MSKKRIVWGVSEGEYSYYRVNVLFGSQEAAEEHVAAGGGDEVQQFVLMEGAPKRLIRWSAHYHEMEDSEGVTVSSDLVWEYEDLVPPVRPKVSEGENARGQFWVNATGRSRQAVVKACADKVAEIKARRAGLA